MSPESANKGDSGIQTIESNDEVSFTDSQTESQINSDSAIQTESLSISDSNVDGSVLILSLIHI